MPEDTAIREFERLHHTCGRLPPVLAWVFWPSRLFHKDGSIPFTLATSNCAFVWWREECNWGFFLREGGMGFEMEMRGWWWSGRSCEWRVCAGVADRFSYVWIGEYLPMIQIQAWVNQHLFASPHYCWPTKRVCTDTIGIAESRVAMLRTVR